MLLENFLKYHGITYTFWRSLADGMVGNPSIYDLSSEIITSSGKPVFPLDRVSSKENWLPFGSQFDNHMFGDTWTTVLLRCETTPWISLKNHHPNLSSIKNLSVKLSDYIKLRF
jgi:hypothetical protein